jgi:hypothetical protein
VLLVGYYSGSRLLDVALFLVFYFLAVFTRFVLGVRCL